MQSTAPRLNLYIISVSALLCLSPCHAEEQWVESFEQDHVIAWVPISEAPTAGVAQAKVHILLSKATRSAEAELCRGNWNLTSRQLASTPPRKDKAPRQLGGLPSWHYQVSREANHLVDCPGVSTFTFQQAVSRHLPRWILLQPALQVSLLQKGMPLPGGLAAAAAPPATLALNR